MLTKTMTRVAVRRAEAANFMVSPKGRVIRRHFTMAAVYTACSLVTWGSNRTLAQAGIEKNRVAVVPLPTPQSLFEPKDTRYTSSQ